MARALVPLGLRLRLLRWKILSWGGLQHNNLLTLLQRLHVGDAGDADLVVHIADLHSRVDQARLAVHFRGVESTLASPKMQR